MSLLLTTLVVAGQEYSKKLEQLAKRGDPKAQFELYECYAYGLGVDINHKEKEEWLEKSARNGYAPAQYELGMSYLSEYDYKVMRAEFSDAEEDVDDPEADLEDGVNWIRKAAEQHYLPALIKMGDLFFNGDGVDQSDHEALKWYLLALDNGLSEDGDDEVEDDEVGDDDEVDDDEIDDDEEDEYNRVKTCVRACQGDVKALYEQDDIFHITQSADKGYLPAIQYLGDFYSGVSRDTVWSNYGEAIEPHFVVREHQNDKMDYASALRYYQLAALQGDQLSQERATLIEAMFTGGLEDAFNLAGLVYKADDDIKSRYHVVDVDLLTEIAMQGYEPAQYELGSYLYSEGDFDAGLWLSLAAEHHYEDAQTLLGFHYINFELYDSAIEAFKTALERDGNDIYASAGIGVALHRMRSFTDAIPWLEKGVADDEKNADYYTLLIGLCQYNLLNYEEAIDRFKELIDSDEFGAHASYRIGQCYYDMADFNEAIHWFNKAATATSYYQIGRMYLDGIGVQQDQDEAIRYFREAIEAYGEIYLDGGFASYDESNGYIPAMEALKELDVYTIEDGRFRRITELRIVDDSDEGDFQIDADE